MIHPDFAEAMRKLCIAGSIAALVSLVVQLAPGVANFLRFGPME